MVKFVGLIIVSLTCRQVNIDIVINFLVVLCGFLWGNPTFKRIKHQNNLGKINRVPVFPRKLIFMRPF